MESDSGSDRATRDSAMRFVRIWRPAGVGQIGEETELAEKVNLVEEQVLGLQRVAVCRIDRRPTREIAAIPLRDLYYLYCWQP